MERKAFGAGLRALRALRGLSVVEAARRAGTSRVTLHRWEAGEQEPSREAFAALLAALGATPPERAALLADAPGALPLSALGDGPLGPPAHPGQLLRALRERRAWSQDRLAGAVGVSRQAVALWEAGQTMPGDEPLGRALAALGAEEIGLREGALDLYDPIVDPLDARLRFRDRRFLAPNPLTVPRQLALERELWPLAARAPRWEESLAEALAWRASYHMYAGEYSLALELARRAMRLAASSGCWDAVFNAANVLSRVRTMRGLSPARQLAFWRDYADRVREPHVRAFALLMVADRLSLLGDLRTHARIFAQAEALLREIEPNEVYDFTHPHCPPNLQDFDCYAAWFALDRNDHDGAWRIYEERIAGYWGRDVETAFAQSDRDGGHLVSLYVDLHLKTGHPVPEATLRILDAHARAAADWEGRYRYHAIGLRLGIYTPALPEPR